MADNWWESAPVVQDAGGAGGKAGLAVGTSKQRGDALQDYQRAMQLASIIDDIEAKFKAGPGSTSPDSIQALGDYLPTPSNKAFDAAAGQLRGFVKSTQNLTGGENNTPTETRMNIGPFIPEASDYDEVIKTKIAALRREQARGLKTAIAMLGGVPDANGRVTPVQGAPAARMAAPAPGVPMRGAAPAAPKRLRYNPATGELE